MSTAPVHHDLTTMARLESDLADARRIHRLAASSLGKLWDRIDAGERVSDDDAALLTLAAAAAVDNAKAAFIAEWKRVGSPLGR